MLTTLIILALSAIFFVSGKVRSDIVGLAALLLLMVFGILTPSEALSGFSNSVVIMMIGLFIVGGGIFQTGLAKKVSAKILELAGHNEMKLFILTMLVTAGIGAFVSNTGTVALMLPIVVSLAAGAGMSASRLLMPMAFASSMGGIMTLIGTPPNLVINSTLIEGGFDGLSFFSFTPVGIVCVIVGLLVLTPMSKWFLSKKDNADDRKGTAKSPGQLADEYQLSQNLYRAKVQAESLLAGKQIRELDIREKFDIGILEVRRIPNKRNNFFKTISQETAGPDTRFQTHDILYIAGTLEQVEKFAEKYRLELMDTHTAEHKGAQEEEGLQFYEIGIAEVVLLPESTLIGQSLKNAGFREKYGINILAIRRKNEFVFKDLKDEKLHSSDVLLIQGSWKNIDRLSKDQSEVIVLGQPLSEASKVTLDYKAPTAAFIMLLMVACMVFDLIPAVAAVILASLLMVLSGCVRNMEEAYKTVNWESVVLIGSMMPMSLALEKTGASAIVSETLVTGLGVYGPMILLAGIYFTTSLLTMFISNTATAVLVAPIALKAAIDMGISPYPFLFAVTVAASMCFASPFSTPPNALVMSAGRYTFIDYVKVGLPLQIIMGIIMIFVLPLLFPFK